MESSKGLCLAIILLPVWELSGSASPLSGPVWQKQEESLASSVWGPLGGLLVPGKRNLEYVARFIHFALLTGYFSGHTHSQLFP